jgi:hypothetical protein
MRHSMIAIAAALSVTACAPESTSVSGTALASSMKAATRWQFNSQKYSDTGARPATGRSGSAALQAEALVDATGAVYLVVTSYRAGDMTIPAGTLEKVQVKIFDAAGRLLSSRNVNGPASGSTMRTLLAGMPAGGTVQVQANVKGIDNRRTDVVTVSGIIAVAAPDLAVTGLVLPGSALTGSPTVIGATIAETGGQHGARGDCVLYVDGIAVDRSSGIWVDAGDVVSCAFTHVFTIPGTHAIRVALENILPIDGGLTNNSASGSLVLLAPQTGGVTSTFDGYVSSGTFMAADTFETTWTAANGSVFLQQRNGSVTTGQQFAFNATGVINTAVTFPLTRVEVAENGDGRLLAAIRLDNLAASSVSPGASCASRDIGDGTALYLCSYNQGFTVVTFAHNAGVVTYQSTEYSKFWNGSSYDENTYVVNDTTAMGAFADVRSLFALNLQVTDGATLYVLNGSGPMNPSTVSDIAPRQCVTSPIVIAPDTYTAVSCFASAYTFNGFVGSLSGDGMSATLP